MEIAIAGAPLFGVILLLAVAIVGLILFSKSRMNKTREEDLSEKYAGHSWSSPLQARNKYPDVDAFKQSGTFFNFGLLAALVLTILAFSWTTYEEVVVIPEGALELEEDIEIEPPRTAEPPPPPPPPPPPVIEEVPEEEIEEEDEPEFVDQSVEEETEAPTTSTCGRGTTTTATTATTTTSS